MNSQSITKVLAVKVLAVKVLAVCLLPYFFASCSTLRDDTVFKQHLANSDCEQALVANEPSSTMKVLSTASQGTGTVASYLLSGIGYTTDVVVQFGGGIAVGFIVCSPVFALEAGMKGTGDASLRCLTEIASSAIEASSFMKIGETTLYHTKNWRCPNYDTLSEGFRKIARCHYDKGEINKSKLQLQKIKDDKKFYDCLSTDEQMDINTDLDYYSR